MFEWNINVQEMIDCIEDNLEESLTLEMLSEKLNYSTYYCSKQFHKYVGISLRKYIYLRKLSASVLELRDSNQRILDISLKYGFSSQEAFTRSFIKAFGITPSKYRKMPKPLPLLTKRNVFNPYYLGLGELSEGKKEIEEINTSIQVLPAHQFIGIRNIHTDNYYNFWALIEKNGIAQCHEVCGILESIKSYNGQIGGWFYKDGRRGYLYGVEVSEDYEIDIPDYMECLYIPESLYVVFHYPSYNFNELDTSVYNTLIEKMNGWDYKTHGFEYNDAYNPTYQRHNPEVFGQAILRPIKSI